MRRARLIGIMAGAVMVLLAARDAQAFFEGIIGYSGKQSDTCGSCHDDGIEPVVELEGPLSFVADTVAQFRFIVRSQGERQLLAGKAKVALRVLKVPLRSVPVLARRDPLLLE